MTDGLPTPRRYFAIFALCAGSIVLMTDGSIASVALPTIAHDLNVPKSQAVFIITLYQLVLSMTIMAFSALGDRIGQRRLYRSGLLIFALTAPLCLFAHSLPVLLAIRTVQALAAAAAMSVTFGMVRDIYPMSQLGRGLGLNTLCSATGGALAPILGGMITSMASWPWVFVAGAPLALMSFLAGRALPDSKPRDHPFDAKGAALCALTFGALIFGAESLIQNSTLVLALALLTLGGCAAVIFVRHELKQENPVLPVDLFSLPGFAQAIAASYICVVGTTVMILSLPFRLQHDYGFSPGEMGAMIAPYAASTVIFAPAAGMLTDRISPKILGAIGLSAAVVAMVFLAFLPANANFFDVAWRLALCGGGSSTFSASNARMIISSVPPERSAAAGGMMTTARMLSLASGATLLAALLASGIGGGPAASLTGACCIAIAFLLAGFFQLPRRR